MLFRALIMVVVSLWLVPAQTVYAASLTLVRDTITKSAPSTTAVHVLEFTLTNAVPLGGTITVTPEAGMFTIPTAFDYTDVDMSVSTGGPFTDRALAALPSLTEDGVSVTTGTSGSVEVTLGQSGLAAGDRVQLVFGVGATFGELADESIENPSSVGSYRMHIRTAHGGTTIDSATAMISINQQVTVTGQPISLAPVRSNGLPAGEIAAGNATIEISLNTDDYATCRYATTTGVAYSMMAGRFSPSLGTTHYATVYGHVNDVTYSYYVRCTSIYDTPNTDDYVISFKLKATPTTNQSLGVGVAAPGGGGASSRGAGNIAYGSQYLYRASVTLSGFAMPLGAISILRDGKKEASVQAKPDGTFSVLVDALERGTYTFLTFAEDSKGKKTATYSSTLTLESGTNNTISNIVLPPSVTATKDTVEVGETISLSGETAPGSTVEVYLQPQVPGQGLGSAKKFIATSTEASATERGGAWSVDVDTAGLTKGTYRIRARTIRSPQAESTYSTVLLVGVGEGPTPDTGMAADINKDGKVNLVDFSIMLTSWGGTNPDADINADGVINLSDFSIMLFNWTG
jgi:hypothetical protein